ncbi:MAG: hypothetical protein V4598_06395 [Bdellovibrionota bacterium]
MRQGQYFQILLLLLVIFVPSEVRALRGELCSSLGKGLELFSRNKCQEATASEYEAACSMKSFDAQYRVDQPINFDQYRQFGYSSSSGLADALTEEVLMNLAANQIAESNSCMVKFYDNFSDTPSGRSQIGQLTRDTFTNLKPALQALLPVAQNERLSYLRPSSELVNKARTVDIVLKDAHDGPRVKFDALIASVPLGNHEEIRRYIARAAIDNYDEQKFFSGYLVEVQKLKAKHQASVNVMSSYRISPNKPVYNVRKGERGSEPLRQALINSGAIENFIITNHAKTDFEQGYLCRRARTDKGCIALTAIEITGSLLIPYVAASVGLRAGLALASRGVTSWSTAEFMGSAISRGLLFSGAVGELALVNEDVINSCLLQHPEYLQSKSQSSCDPQKMAFEAASEASLANCIATVAMGVTSLGTAATLSYALKGMKVENAAEEIVVMASRNTSGVRINSVPQKDFYRAVYNNYEQVFDDQIIAVLNRTDEALDASRASLGTVYHDNKIAGTWRVYEATKRSGEDAGDLLPYMRSNALRDVPPLKADAILKAEIAAGKRVAEMGKFSVDYRLPPEVRGSVVKNIEENWLKLANENPDAVLVAHVGTKLHVRLYRKYGFKVIEEYRVPGTDITEWILTSTGRNFRDTLNAIK